MAVQTPGGELYGYVAPAAGNTVEIPIVLTDAAGAVVTGVTYDAAGMAVWYSKPGATNYLAFPTFDTNNWRELLLGTGGAASGEYRIILRQSDAGELALLDTSGMMTFYVKCTATRGDRAIIKVNAADVVRDDQWTDDRAAVLDDVPSAAVWTEALATKLAQIWRRLGFGAIVRNSTDATVKTYDGDAAAPEDLILTQSGVTVDDETTWTPTI